MYHIIWFLELPNFHFSKGHFRFGSLYPCLNYCAALYLMSTLIGIFAQFERIVIVEIGMDLYNMKNEVPQNSLYFWNYQCSIVYFLQDSNNWITFFDDLFFKTFFFYWIFLSTTNIISTIREQTGIRRKRNKFVLFDNHSLISDRFSFFFYYPINHNCILRYTRNIRHLIFSTFS